jgi:ABC-type lipoprotein release transport system permease subunit
VQRRFGTAAISPELYLGTHVAAGREGQSLLGLVRGVTPAAPLVRRGVRIVEGRWPGPGEVLAGRLAHAKLGCRPEELAVGQSVRFEGRSWRIAGRFVAGGTAFDAELWCPLDDLQQATKRQDLSLAAVLLAPGAAASEVVGFCAERTDLELQAMRETEYYALLEKHSRPVRLLGWLVAGLVAAAGVFAGLNTMYGAVAGRVRELAALQALGFRRRAIAVSLIQEAALLAVAGSLLAAAAAVAWADGLAVRFSMGAFRLRIDGPVVLLACGAGLALGVLGAIPPAVRAMRAQVAESLKAVG